MKRAFLGAFALVTATALTVQSGAAPAPKARPVQRDWSRTVVATPEGGFRMGNPAARVKLIEYGSLTCSHCAAFARTGTPTLVANHVRRGTVSYEYRNFVLNGADLAASLLARCSGPHGFFRFADSLYAAQGEWMGRLSGMSAAQSAELQSLPPAERLVRLAEIGGLTQRAAGVGVTPAKARLCLADQAAVTRLGQMYGEAEQRGVLGTPTFYVNGVRADVITWAALEPIIRRAGG